ncbi:Na+/H+ antiporter [uncultured Senegalimassilia sp.]|uniref:Na+/H+ antiporter n=1 Tax=uncultured Senegalimassilia sp. TaxID=1714350 RepID=UPI00258B98C9|nr:Na+/H+ antiporter [uncultured Senegalimassilia sp.]
MEMLEFVLLLLAAVLVSAVLDQMMPRVSLPLVQIAIGAIVILLVGTPVDVAIDPELFLVLFIAPLLFDESRHASKRGLWDNKGSIVSLAIGLVIVTVLVVGFVLNWIEPSIPLAAAFALGAALGPTDAVAVTALGKDIRLTGRQKSLLSGEALINDASGVVSFQFAIAAAVTGAFSLVDAAQSFAISFFGGIAIGLIAGFLALLAMKAIRGYGYESITVHVVFEVFTPFIVFLAAEHFGTSGILAVVAAGLLITLLPQKPTPVAARLKIASNSVWETLVFVINGVVFVMLGMQLPKAIMPSWRSDEVSSLLLCGLVLLVTALVVGVRFIWVLVMERCDSSAKRHTSKQLVRDALVTTLSGPKGAVTLSIIMTIPFTLSTGEAFPQRDTLIFLASGVILCTLLLANFVVPVLAPKEDSPDETEEQDVNAVTIDILKRVIRQLREQKTPQNESSTQIVIRQYSERIKRLRRQNTSAPRLVELRAGALAAQTRMVEARMQSGDLTREEGSRELERLNSARRLLMRAHTRREKLGEVWSRVKVGVMHARRNLDRMVRHVVDDELQLERSRQLRIELEECALNYYLGRMDDADLEVADGAGVLAAECRSTLSFLRAANEPAVLARANVAGSVIGVDAGGMRGALQSMDTQKIQVIKARVTDVEAEALRLELEEIQAMRDEGRLTRDAARELREEVYLLQMATGE